MVIKNVKKSKQQKPDWSKYAFGDSLTKKVNKLAKDVKRAKPSIKFKSRYTPVTPVNNAINLLNVVEILVGTTDSTRIGSQVKLNKLYLNYEIKHVSADTNVRVIIFYDKKPSAGLANYSLLYEAVDTLSHKNMDNSDRFKILKDMNHSMNTASNPLVIRKLVIDFKDLIREWKQDGVTDEANTPYILIISDVASLSTCPTYRLSYKMTYTDA